MPHSHSKAVAGRLVLGLALFTGGVLAAWALLPEGRWRQAAAPQEAVEVFQGVAEELGVVIVGEAPRLRLATQGQESQRVRRALRERASSWLANHHGAAQVVVEQRARWDDRPGWLIVVVGAAGRPRSVTWSPGTLGELFGAELAGVEESICAPLLAPDEGAGAVVTTELGQGRSVLQGIIPQRDPPEHLALLNVPGPTVLCERRLGDLDAGSREVAAESVPRLLVRGVPAVAGFLVVAGLFVWLALRRRLDLVHGALLATAGAVTSLGSLAAPRPDALFTAIGALLVAVGVFLVWSVGESMTRADVPGFSTSLDSLRRGRLGRRAGRALVHGVALGAALAGARLGVSAMSELLPGVRPTGLTVAVPLFGLGANPIVWGTLWCGLALLALAVARHLLPGGLALTTAAVVPALFLEIVPLHPWPARLLAATLLSGALLVGLRRFGVTSALVASVVAYALPSGVWALRALEWAPGSAAGGLALAAGPLILGVVGVARDRDDREREAAPSFVRRLERERRLAYEMDLLSRIQTGLLPRKLPSLAGYEVTARSLLATEAGGDLYDFLRDDRGRLWIACGDVAGHGYSCAIAQATVKAALVSLVDGVRTPAEVLAGVDRVLRATLSEQQFVTLVLVRLTPASGELLVANAGHPFALVWQEGEVRELDLPGLPLGQGPPRSYRDLTVTLAPGEVLLLYSDGLAEAMGPGGQEYGFERPRAALARAAGWNAAEVLERLLWDWRSHLDGRPHLDDTTLLVLKRQRPRSRAAISSRRGSG